MRNMLIFAAIAFGGMCLASMCDKPVRRFVGTVEGVSSWDGGAVIRAKGLLGTDTLINVIAKRRERFVAGQVITVWSGGGLIRDDVASTDPNNRIQSTICHILNYRY